MDNGNNAVETEYVNHPDHYNQYEGFEVIDVCEKLRSGDGSGNFNRGNAFKYLARAGWKSPAKEVEDLEKTIFYVQREIDRLKKTASLVVEERINDVEEYVQPNFDDLDLQVNIIGPQFNPKYTGPEFLARMKTSAPHLFTGGNWAFPETEEKKDPRNLFNHENIPMPDEEIATSLATRRTLMNSGSPLCPKCSDQLKECCSTPLVYFCTRGHGQMVFSKDGGDEITTWVRDVNAVQ